MTDIHLTTSTYSNPFFIFIQLTNLNQLLSNLRKSLSIGVLQMKQLSLDLSAVQSYRMVILD